MSFLRYASLVKNNVIGNYVCLENEKFTADLNVVILFTFEKLFNACGFDVI